MEAALTCFQDLLDMDPGLSGARFFDMDGVLAVYERRAYAERTASGKLLYEDERMHYFRTCEPDRAAMDLFRRFHEKGVRTYALTTVRPDLPWIRFDKVWWLAKHAPWFDPSTRLIIASGDKAQVAMALLKAAALSPRHVLLDDFNPNLEDWKAAGGTAVKYLNGVNTPGTFDGPQYRPS